MTVKRSAMEQYLPMAMHCKKCGMTTHKKDAEECLICGEQFPESLVNAHRGKTSVADRASATQRTEEPSIQTVSRAERSWLTSAINRRAKGGVFIGIAMTAIGLYGGAFSRRGATIGGLELVLAGLSVLAISVLLITCTRTPKA